MRVELGKSVLADGTLEAAVQNWQEEDIVIAERIVPARSTKIRLRDRGGRSISISFAVEREFTTVLAAQKFNRDHLRTVTRFGVLTVISMGDGSEGAEEREYGAMASLESVTPTFEGCVSRIGYKIISEPLSKDKPT